MSYRSRPVALFLVVAAVTVGAVASAHAAADAATSKAKPTATARSTATSSPPSSATPKPATRPGAPRAGDGWRQAPPAAWVERHDGPPPAPGALPARDGWHALRVDLQDLIDRDGQVGRYVMVQTLVTSEAGLGSAGRVEVSFDPAYEKATLHAMAVWRDGRRADRLADARIEVLRREDRLQNDTIDGRKTLLVVLNDVRVGDVVETAYTVDGHNPIHGASHDGVMQTAFGVPIDRLDVAVTSRWPRALHVKGERAGELPPVVSDGGVQRWRLQRQDVAAVEAEPDTPPEFAVHPYVTYSDDPDWHEVAAWAAQLFAVDPSLGPELEQRVAAWKAGDLRDEALASAVLGVVQEDVRYFSASLGENSHRPKPPARTWADRAGDCKDKTALLVALLRRLGFDAQPVLVSTTARASLRDELPRHDAFDHAMVKLNLNGRTWWLDGTRTNQATRLETRATTRVDWALVADPATRELEAVHAPALEGDLVAYDHVWDMSDLQKPARLRMTVTTRGEAAESFRGLIAGGHLGELADSLGQRYGKRFTGYKASGQPVVTDDRAANRLSVRLDGEAPSLGELKDGVLSVEVYPIRIIDSLVQPDKQQRTMPWYYDESVAMTEQLRVLPPTPQHSQHLPDVEVADPHFALRMKVAEDGGATSFTWRYQRRSDVVQPAELARFRERIKAARSEVDLTMTTPLVANDRFKARIADVLKATAGDPRMRGDDQVAERIGEALGRRTRDDMILERSGVASWAGTRALLDHAVQNLLVADDAAALEDLSRLPPDALATPAAQYTRGLALLAAGQYPEAEKAWRGAADVEDAYAGPVRRWIGIAAYYDGRYGDAVRSLREAADDETGDTRQLTLAWLFLAAQRNDGSGKATVAALQGGEHETSWPATLVTALGALWDMNDQKTPAPNADFDTLPQTREMARLATQDKALVRERTVQMGFFVSQLVKIGGDEAGARELLGRMAELHATAVAEDLCARAELRHPAKGRS